MPDNDEVVEPPAEEVVDNLTRLKGHLAKGKLSVKLLEASLADESLNTIMDERLAELRAEYD